MRHSSLSLDQRWEEEEENKKKKGRETGSRCYWLMQQQRSWQLQGQDQLDRPARDAGLRRRRYLAAILHPRAAASPPTIAVSSSLVIYTTTIDLTSTPTTVIAAGRTR